MFISSRRRLGNCRPGSGAERLPSEQRG